MLFANERVENEEFIARSFFNKISAFFLSNRRFALQKEVRRIGHHFNHKTLAMIILHGNFDGWQSFPASVWVSDSVFRQKIDNLNEIVIFINSYEWKSWMLLSAMSLSLTFARNVRSANHFTMKCFHGIDSVVVTWIDNVWVL